MAERANARLKNEFGASAVRVQVATPVAGGFGRRGLRGWCVRHGQRRGAQLPCRDRRRRHAWRVGAQSQRARLHPRPLKQQGVRGRERLLGVRPGVNNQVYALGVRDTVTGGNLYLGGNFTLIIQGADTYTRNRIAALDASTFGVVSA